MTQDSGLRLAATCMPVRDVADGIELLMVRRNQELSFGGMWTFPGGVIEPDDGPLPATIDENLQHWGEPSLLTTAAAAAARETREETALVANMAALAWFSHWIPPVQVPKRFATWFFVAPEVSGELELETSENDESRWLSPSIALQNHADGAFPLAAPTWVTLDDLRAFTSVADLVDHAVTQGARLHHTRAYRSPGGRTLCWLGDEAYETGDLDAPGGRNRAVVNADFQIVDRISD